MILVSDDAIDGSTLHGVSATTLWTLHNRAVEAARPEGVIIDPWAVELRHRISSDYDKFGRPSQLHPLRARAFDAIIRACGRDHPRLTVVTLGEGLQTSYWRLTETEPGPFLELSWISVDRPPVIALRKRLLPAEPAITSLAGSALDRIWMDAVDSEQGVVITAEGLLMYPATTEAWALITECARRFPEDVMPPPGRGPWGNPLIRAAANLPPLRDHPPSITALTFGEHHR